MAFTRSAVNTTIIRALADQPTETATQLKTKFDEYAENDKTYTNGTLLAELESTTAGSSGAENIGSAAIAGITGTTVRAQIADLKTQQGTLDGANVKLTGDQTVAGVKTFSSSPVVPTPTTDMQASTKKYVDDENLKDVHLTGNQTVAGVKTFSSSPIVPTPTTDMQASTKKYADVLDATNVHKTGNETVAGVKTFSDAPVISAITNTGTLTLPTSTDTLVGRNTTDTLANKTLTAPKIGTGGFIADSNGNELIKFPATVASAVNEVTIKNAATGVAPSIEATGTDTDIQLTLKGKGTKGVAEGSGTASGAYSHAEGLTTTASGSQSHAEGYSTIASGANSHAEGYGTIAVGYSHAEGYATVASTDYAHTEGQYNLACHGVDYKITAYDNTAKTITLENVTELIVGDLLNVKISNSVALTDVPITAINGLVVTLSTTETITSNWKYAIEKVAAPYATHAEGLNTLASGGMSHAEGNTTIASGSSSHAEGFLTTASGLYSHAEGYLTTASGRSSHAEGYLTTASGNTSHAEGYLTTASGTNSHAGGYGTQAKYAQHTIGQFGTVSASSDTTYNATGEAFMIGNGADAGTRGLAFKVMFDGKTYADGAYASTGADYAEYFEWLDGNPDAEERMGFFVTMDGEKIRKATESDAFVLGVVSSTPSVVGDNHEAWQGRYITDEWGRIQYHEVLKPAVVDEEGNEIQPERYDKEPMYNPEWNPETEYISREHRPEWSAVGMMGKLLTRDDGSCVVNGYAKPNNQGIAKASPSGYRVMKRVSENVVLLLVK